MKKLFVVCVSVLLAMCALVYCVAEKGLQVRLPAWSPKNPSAEFIRAAKVLKPLNADTKQDASARVPMWECFGALTDKQLKSFMKIQQEKLNTAKMNPKSLSYMKQHYGAVEKDNFLVYDTRRITIPVKSLPAVQRKAFDKAIESNRADLLRYGALKDMSNVDLVFDAKGCHEVWFSLCIVTRRTANNSTSMYCTLGPFGYVNK